MLAFVSLALSCVLFLGSNAALPSFFALTDSGLEDWGKRDCLIAKSYDIPAGMLSMP